MTGQRQSLIWWRPVFGLLILLGLLSSVEAQSPVPEQQLKAAFVLNFIRYIEWPEKVFSAKDSPIVLCRLGRDDGDIPLASLDGRKAQERIIKVRFDVGADNARGCHAVFFGEADSRRASAMLRSLTGMPVLTISDVEGFIDQGGAIGIVRGDERMQFEINRSVLDRSQLKASSQLLKLARAVLSPGG